jgi:hypothetical protein
MASYVLVRHKVRDYASWKQGYDAHLPVRQQAGLAERHVLRSVDDPEQVVILFEAKDLDAARAFASSQDLRDTMQRAGVLDRPDIYFLNG